MLCSSLIIGQGAVGWWMVKSGLKDFEKDLEKKQMKNQEVKVSPFRLGAHLTSAFLILSLFTQ